MANCTFEEIMDSGEVIIANGVSGKAPTDNDKTNNKGAAKTEVITASTKEVTLTDAKNAWTSGNTSLSSALDLTGSAIVSGVNSAAKSVSQYGITHQQRSQNRSKARWLIFLKKVM
jgi:hypothetical protein